MPTKVRIVLSVGAEQPSVETIVSVWRQHLANDTYISADVKPDSVSVLELIAMGATDTPTVAGASFIGLYDHVQDIGIAAYFPTPADRSAFVAKPDFSIAEYERQG